MKLFILPFTGGYASYFDIFVKRLAGIETIAIDFSGRGRRKQELSLHTFDENLMDFYQVITKISGEEPFSIWGHSLGALYAYELAGLMESNNKPSSIFLSGRTSPEFKFLPEEKILDDQEQLERHMISAYSFAPAFIKSRIGSLQVQQIVKDYKVMATYSSSQKIVNSRTIVMYASSDPLCENVNSWDRYVHNKISYHEFDGGHFFITKYVEEICSLIEREI